MITRKEKFDLRRGLRADIAKVLRHIADTHLYSPKVVATKQDDPLFEDTCNYVNFHAAIMEFARTLEANNKYDEIIIKDIES